MTPFVVVGNEALATADPSYRLANVHPFEACAGTPCVIHSPTEHHMADWPLHWRNDRKIFERICPEHGVGHPDPDQHAHWKATGQQWQGVHGCCGCCVATVPS